MTNVSIANCKEAIELAVSDDTANADVDLESITVENCEVGLRVGGSSGQGR